VTISDSTETFFNKTVKEYDPDSPVALSDDTVYRLALDWDAKQTMPELIEHFLSRVDKKKLDALIIGAWGEPHDNSANGILATLVAHAAELPNLRALFVGDMTYEECEISWIVQGNYNPLLDAFPQLEVLRIRGSTSLELTPFSHPNLREFIVECGGLPSTVALALTESNMPRLEHLELWLGTENYGFDGDADLYRRVLAQLRTPSLRYLGLRDSEIADQLAQWLAGEASIAQLDTLDLSLGTIGDVGAEALFNSPHLSKLKCLNLSHHFISSSWQDKLRTLPIKVVLDDAQEEEEDDGETYRYVAVGE
jgi:hypothetical protein